MRTLLAEIKNNIGELREIPKYKPAAQVDKANAIVEKAVNLIEMVIDKQETLDRAIQELGVSNV